MPYSKQNTSSNPSIFGIYMSKTSPIYPWKVPQMFHQQFMKEFLSLWGFGEVWGIFPGSVGKIMEYVKILRDVVVYDM